MIEPLTPPDSDLQDFPFMPLHVARLRDSDLASEVDPEACWYAVMLWSASWHQLPAGSLPDNEVVLAKLCGLGRDLRTFRRHRDGALRNFVKCSDGRLYHPVVAEQVKAAWESKQQQRWRTELARIKKANQRGGHQLPSPSFEEFVSGTYDRIPVPSPPLVPGDSANGPPTVPGDNGKCPPGQGVQGTGTGTGNNSSVPDGTGGQPPDEPPVVPDELAELRAMTLAQGSFYLALKVLMERGGKTRDQAAQLIGKLRHAGLTDDQDIWETAEIAWRVNTPDPYPLMVKTAQGVIDRRAGRSGIDNPSERQQRAWMADWREKGAVAWRRHERGPFPGEPGCRVSPEIQAEQSQSEAA